MHHLTRIAFVASIAAVALTAACSDSSSGPSAADQAKTIALHFDSIYVDAKAKSDSGAAVYGGRAALASLLEIPGALGVLPSTIQVTTAMEPEQWKGYEFLELNANSTDSTFVLLAYRESDAHTVLVVFFNHLGMPQQGGLFTEDTIAVTATSGSAATSLLSATTTCGTPPSSLLNPEFATPLFSSCKAASFHIAASLVFSSNVIDPGLASLTFTPTPATIKGVRVIDASSGPARRVRALLAAKGFTKGR